MLNLETGTQEETRGRGVSPSTIPVIPTTKELVVEKLKKLGLGPIVSLKDAQIVERILEAAELFPPFGVPKGWKVGFFSDPTEPFLGRVWLWRLMITFTMSWVVTIPLAIYLIILGLWIYAICFIILGMISFPLILMKRDPDDEPDLLA